jgi:hypothetical protein
MPTRLYKGFEIIALPIQNRYSGRWTVTVHINGGGRNITIYEAAEFDTRGQRKLAALMKLVPGLIESPNLYWAWSGQN